MRGEQEAGETGVIGEESRMAGKLQVKNWKKHQHYKDRNPPWIKLHGCLLTDDEFACLQDASKLHLICIWLLARNTDGVIPDDPKWVKKCAGLDEDVDLNPLIQKGFLIRLQDASNMLATCASETETETDSDRADSGQITLAAELAQEFHFRIPGTSKPMLPDLTAEFQAKLDWLAAHGRNVTEHIRGCIKDPKRDKTASNTIGKMWKFWEFCGLLESNDGKQRNSNAGGSPKHSAGGGRYEGLLPRLVKDDA